DLREPGDLLDEVILIEPVRSGFRVDLRVGLSPTTRPVASETEPRDLVLPTLVHRALHRTLETTVHAWPDIAGFDVDARPFVIGRCSGNRFDQPDVVVVDVDQTGDHAAILGQLFRIDVLVAADADLNRLTSAHVLEANRGDDRLQLVGMDGVIVELRPARLTAWHEVPAIEVADQCPRPRRFRDVVEVPHDPEETNAAVL